MEPKFPDNIRNDEGIPCQPQKQPEAGWPHWNNPEALPLLETYPREMKALVQKKRLIPRSLK